MSDSLGPNSDRQALPKVTLTAAVLVLFLALGAALLPQSAGYEMREIFLVYDAPGIDGQREEFFQALNLVLAEISGHSMELLVAESPSEFRRLAADGVDFTLCPDGLALQLDQQQYTQMATGRRKLPNNLRPRGVMVYRKSGGEVPRPWESHPRRTVFGDSLSLVSVGGVGPVSQLGECAFGPDPYNHGAVLHALRLGAFDYALVRQWDADDFFSAGLLDSKIWGVRNRTIPVPDIVLMASRKIPLVDRLKWSDTLALIGRSGQTSTELTDLLINQLDKFKLAGFNILLEPDFELVRRNFARHWPAATD